MLLVLLNGNKIAIPLLLNIYVQGHVHKNRASVYHSKTQILVAWMAWQYHKGCTPRPLI